MTDVKGNKKWFAVYVKSRCEKKVSQQLDDMGIESFLPLITRIKQWSDRKKKVEEPLFRSYIFVNITSSDYYNVLNIANVVRFITFEKKPVVVPENQITAIRKYICDTDLHDIECDSMDLKEGELVRIKTGQMKDLIGRFIKIKGKHRVIIDIEAVGQSLPVNIARSNVEAIK
ncbi:MAG: UpxY family transcription antiterminator [Bacteroidales bacterium]|nr:UpxY family transcription antiterminator [Bacteroidales bacterium]